MYYCVVNRAKRARYPAPAVALSDTRWLLVLCVMSWHRSSCPISFSLPPSATRATRAHRRSRLASRRSLGPFIVIRRAPSPCLGRLDHIALHVILYIPTFLFLAILNTYFLNPRSIIGHHTGERNIT